MIKYLQILILLFITNLAYAQLGSSIIGRSTIGTDSLFFPVIGKAATPKCTSLGSCDNSTCIAYTFTGAGEWSIEENWVGGVMPPAILTTDCSQIIIDPKGSAECILNIPLQIIPKGTSLIVKQNKKFRIPGNLVQEQ